jgi:hypothetical protein
MPATASNRFGARGFPATPWCLATSSPPRASIVDLDLTPRRRRHIGHDDGLVRQRVGFANQMIREVRSILGLERERDGQDGSSTNSSRLRRGRC